MIKTLAEQRVFAYSIAIIYNVFMTYKRTKKISVAIINTVIAIILGTVTARIIWFINSGNKDISQLFIWKLKYFKISGVLIGGALGMLISIKIFPKYRTQLIDTMMESIFLSAAVGKIECFIKGCCVGKVMPDKILSYTVALGYIHIEYPVQLIETGVWLIGFCILVKYKGRISDLKRIALAVLEYVIMRMFVIEQLFRDAKLFGGPKMIVIYCCIITICLIVLFKDIKKYLNCSIFGRVTPNQKHEIIKELKKEHTVAYVGDGVNDVLALKESDCSIAPINGSDAAKNVSQIVLMDSNFDSMPTIVNEGRKAINNIERSASLFIVKTIYASLLALLFIFIDLKYPFIPIQLTLTSALTIGIPSFILALEPNYEKVKGNFFINIFSKAFPTALTIVINILIVVILGSILKLSEEQVSTLSVILTGFIGFMHIYIISKPLTPLRMILLSTLITVFVIGIVGLRTLFSLAFITPYLLLLTLILMANTLIIFILMTN